jgi:hypothetical protein
MQTLLVTLSRRLRLPCVAVLLQGWRCAAGYCFGLSESVFRHCITIVCICGRTESPSAMRPRAARRVQLACKCSMGAKQVSAEQAVQAGFYLSKDHPHASLVHTAISNNRAGRRELSANADGFVARRAAHRARPGCPTVTARRYVRRRIAATRRLLPGT